MTRATRSLPLALALGQLVGLLGWLDALFVPLVLAGPVLTGVLVGASGARAGWIALLWASAGVNMLWTDWVVNGEDQLFHLVVAAVMAALSLLGWSTGRLVLRLRSRDARPAAG